MHTALAQAKEAALAARAPFQWADGPLVTAMRQGDIILIDELNLAEDAVLERMNRSAASCADLMHWEHTGRPVLALLLTHPRYQGHPGWLCQVIQPLSPAD